MKFAENTRGTVLGPLPLLAANPTCTACKHHVGRKSVCVPTRPLYVSGRTRALLVVGEAPGRTEDETGQCFVGPTGLILCKLYLRPGLSRPALWDVAAHADVYLGNAIRCDLRDEDNPGTKSLNTCRSYLEADIQELSACYQNITILCVGSVATQSVLKKKLTVALKHQGESVSVAGVTCTVFCTNHPAALLSRRDPSLATGVCDHLRLLMNHFNGSARWALDGLESAYTVAPAPPLHMPSLLALDIETYGKNAQFPPQTQFHPAKCVAVDKVATDELIRTVAISWREDNALRSAVFVMSDPAHRRNLWGWLRRLHTTGGSLLGMNLKFDLSFLRYVYPWTANEFLSSSLHLIDLSAINYLHNELRSEKSLKDLAHLFGVTVYPHEERERRYSSDYDPALWAYNVKDTQATYAIYEILCDGIRQDYGASTTKLSRYCLQWYSDLIWTAIFMSEVGVSMYKPLLESLLSEHTQGLQQINSHYITTYGTPLFGPGSKPSSETAMNEAVDRAIEMDADLRLLEKTKTGISTGKQNLNLLLGILPESPERTKLKHIQTYRSHLKLVSSYLKPLLSESGLINGIVYPDWYAVPANTKDDTDDPGGTIQCRMTCKRPALQTNPKSIKKALYTRFFPGFLYYNDLNQIELRVAGLLSQDQEFLRIYSMALSDLHGETAKTIFGPDCASDPVVYEEIYRQGGKRTNFLMLYRGGADKLQETLLRHCDLMFALDRCQDMVAAYFRKYRGLDHWQNELIAKAVRDGFLELPLMGASRRYTGNKKTVKATYTNTICNQLVQSIAANILESAQGAIIRELHARKMRTVSGVQIYDALYAEGPLQELRTVHEIMQKHVLNAPYWQDLCAHLGRTFPLQGKAQALVWDAPDSEPRIIEL